MAAVNIPIRTKGQTACVHHKGKQLELYCETCQDLVCLKCLFSGHKGHIVCELSDITPKKKQDIKNFIDRASQHDLVQVGKYIDSTQTLLKDNDSKFEKLSHQLKMQTDKIKEGLDKLTATTLSLYQKMKEDNTKLIEKYKQDLEMYDKQLKQQIQECKTALQRGSDIEIYDTGYEIHFPVKPVLGTASFTPNKTPDGNLKLALGNVITSVQGDTSTEKDPSVSTSDNNSQLQSSTQQQQQSGDKGDKAVIRYKLLSETKVVEEWKSPCVIGSICHTDDGVWTSDYYSNTLTLLDRKGTVKRKATHRTTINNISVSSKTNTLWICDRENNIHEQVSGYQFIRRFSTEEVPRCLCVTASNDVIVGMPKHISKFTIHGKLLITTKDTGSETPFVCSPYRITACPVTHNVAVICFSEMVGGDGDKHVVIMNKDFQKIFICIGDIPNTGELLYDGVRNLIMGSMDESFNPSGVVYDSLGNLIIGDFNNHRVLLLSGVSGSFKILHRDTLGMLAVGVDREDVLWAVFGDSSADNVKLLRYSKMR
ncbi:uncharacterized protein LOC117314930 [Pecten maximus]|uniref:uncharacterized protein LOC117314930 n=1 Tax=Pecten maximus TaxID=6579 RepID=UPI001457F5AF|nr:uncharacterized protein LOC117314930 [Pecten maximus]